VPAQDVDVLGGVEAGLAVVAGHVGGVEVLVAGVRPLVQPPRGPAARAHGDVPRNVVVVIRAPPRRHQS
jgi:hypothetical protein